MLLKGLMRICARWKEGSYTCIHAVLGYHSVVCPYPSSFFHAINTVGSNHVCQTETTTFWEISLFSSHSELDGKIIIKFIKCLKSSDLIYLDRFCLTLSCAYDQIPLPVSASPSM